MAGLLYGSGLRLHEVVTLRVKDVDLERRQVVVRGGKGGKHRLTVLPERYRAEIERHLAEVRRTWIEDCAVGYGGTTFPPALEGRPASLWQPGA